MEDFFKEGIPFLDRSGIYSLIDLKIMQNILDHFSKATGLSLVTVDHRGKPITQYSGFTNFCSKIRTFGEYRDKCHQCDREGGLEATIKGEPYVYICHAGLVDFAIPIMIQGNYLGAVLAGQVKVEVENTERLTRIIPCISEWENNAELTRLYDEILEVPFEKIESIAYTLHEMTKYIVEKEYINIVKERLNYKYMEYIQEERRQTELESSLRAAELKALQYQINPHFLFNALNTICRLAYMEKAEKTEEIGYAFSEMMRYILRKNTSQLVKLKDEIDHSKNYLKIQKIRLGERLNYSIDIPAKYEDVECPFMMLQPLIENSVKYVIEGRTEGGNIDIAGYHDGGDLVISVEDNGDGIPQEKVQYLFSSNGLVVDKESTAKEQIGLANVNKRLVYFFGNEYGLKISNMTKWKTGTIIEIRIPLREF